MSGGTYDIKVKRIRTFFLGNERPALFSRILFYCSLPLFVYYLFAFTLELLAIRLIETLPNAVQIKESLDKVGERYAIEGIENVFFQMALTGLIGTALFFAGMLLIWRKKYTGYPVYIVGLLICMTAPWLFFGYGYYVNEQSIIDWIIPSFVLIMALTDWAVKSRRTT